MAEGKLTYQHTDAEQTSEPAKKKRREVMRVEHVHTVAEHFKQADLSSVTQVSSRIVPTVCQPYLLITDKLQTHFFPPTDKNFVALF